MPNAELTYCKVTANELKNKGKEYFFFLMNGYIQYIRLYLV